MAYILKNYQHLKVYARYPQKTLLMYITDTSSYNNSII